MKKRIVALIAATAMTVSTLPVIAAENDEPVLQYTFDESNELADVNGKNELKLYGGASITDDGNNGKALLLDGTDGYALLPEDIVSDSMTVSAWVKINQFTTWGRVFDLGSDANNNFFFAPYSGSSSRVEIKTPNGVDTMDCAQESEREWVHYAITYGDGAVSYYRNGRLINSKKVNQKLSDLKDELNYIGKSHYDGDAYLAATVDDFRVYDRVLDTDEICSIISEGNINPEVMLDSYAIADEQILTGDYIDLPKSEFVTWSEKDNLGLINVETGEVKHNENAETVTLTAAVGDVTKDYTVYVTGSSETPYTISVDTTDRSKDISDIMWGLFFEDINSAADGGLYAELVQNRSFEIENDEHLYSWTVDGGVKVNTENPLNENNPTYMTMEKNASAANDGFDGMSIKEGEKYDFSVYVKGETSITVDLDGSETELSSTGDEWQKLTAEITAPKTDDSAVLTVTNNGETADFDMISLIPQDTYKGHGLRKDLMEQLEAMHPKFLRFPGGCAIEGETMDTAWNWKDTIGDVSERKEMINIWNPSATEPYMMTYGLGFYEYFQMCEDLGMEPIPILNCGIACQVRSGSAEDEEHLVPMDELQPYIDDALDLIAFANGTDESNEWTKKRIEMGHPEPFNLKYIGIGNEQYGEIYFERYAEFAKQIHEKYPDINLVTTSGTASSGTSNDLAWNWAGENQEYADFMDEHYYETADWFRQNVQRYDNYSRDINTKVFLGEYASKGNTWYNALSEAAYMTGLERNSDVVRMASYAPMFAKYGNVQWSAANMIWFTNDDFVLTPNYYVQSLFSNNQGDYSLPTEVSLTGIEKDDKFHGGMAVGTWGTQAEYKDITIQSDGDPAVEIAPDSEDWIFGAGDWSVTEEGTLSQSSDITGAICYIDDYDKNAGNTVISLKAKKNGGGEGFQVGVSVKDSLNYYRVNIGGWGNSTAKVQHIVDGVSVQSGNVAEQAYVGNVHINDGEWYDVRVEVSDYEIKGYVNDELVCSYIKPKEYGPVYASSVYDEETNEVIVKVVNTLNSDVDIDIDLNGTKTSGIETTVMSGDTALENSLDNKDAIKPVTGGIDFDAPADMVKYTAKANSLNILRCSLDGNISKENKPYINGYDDGTFRPDKPVTRAETAAMIMGNEDTGAENKFSDVADDAWYKNAVSSAVEKGIINGYECNVFMPDEYITRAEFVLVVTRFLGLDENTDKSMFSDVEEDSWAKGYINAIAKAGYITGYEDGTFRPFNDITRSEAVKILNKVKNIEVKEYTENPFSDLSESHWAYNEILSAVYGG